LLACCAPRWPGCFAPTAGPATGPGFRGTRGGHPPPSASCLTCSPAASPARPRWMTWRAPPESGPSRSSARSAAQPACRPATAPAYVNHLRVRLARRLLDGGVAPAEVAVRAGFADQAHLTRHFKRVVGVPPRAYQRERWNEQERSRPAWQGRVSLPV